jgi:beta-lactam-binding protein with PASTA domain
MLVASLGIIIIVFLVLKIYARQGKEYVLPDVVGFSVSQLQDDNPLDLDYVIMDSVYRPGEAGGIIIVQSPKAGTKIKKNRKIYLTITANSPNNITAPELQDITLKQAVNLLERSNLQVGNLTFVDNPYNVVVSASYNGHQLVKGDPVPSGSRIDLTVGLGDNSATSIVPFVIGKTSDKARDLIFAASLNVGREHFNGVQEKSTAVVVKQDPDYTGVSQYPYGTAVELWYQDANTVDVNKLVRDFKVDSSKIIQPEQDDETSGNAATGDAW